MTFWTWAALITYTGGLFIMLGFALEYGKAGERTKWKRPLWIVGLGLIVWPIIVALTIGQNLARRAQDEERKDVTE